jgi:hypothetical protein
MGAIRSDFYYLAKDDDLNKIADYQSVVQTLTELGLPLPAESPETIAYAQMLLHLQTVSGDLLKTEILTNPHGHYTGLSYAEICDAFVTPLSDEDEFPRISVVWHGVPYTPNMITEDDVIGALNDGK